MVVYTTLTNSTASGKRHVSLRDAGARTDGAADDVELTCMEQNYRFIHCCVDVVHWMWIVNVEVNGE